MRDRSAIHGNFIGVKRTDFERLLVFDQRRVRRGEIEKHPFDSDRWKPAKDQLKVETHDKCAYCEAPTSMVAYGDVEHYRPKSKYWWLAYAYENYLVSCQLCNQKFKSDSFPIRNSKLKSPFVAKNSTDGHLESLVGGLGPDPEQVAAVTVFVGLHTAERPLLLNPYYDDPAGVFAWAPDDTLREVRLVPDPGNAHAAPFVQAALEFYGLNRKTLLDLRYFIYQAYRTFRVAAADPGISPATGAQITAMIATMAGDAAPFAGMIRYFESLPALP